MVRSRVVPAGPRRRVRRVERRIGRGSARRMRHPSGHGPGGAYRYDRVECEPQAVWSDFDRWASERPLDVEDQPLRGDRYGGWTWIFRASPIRVRTRDRPGTMRPIRPIDVAGRDADGFLVWPGKLP